MPLDKAQFVAPPGSVGATPAGFQTGGVKQGSNITIAPDGTISSSGGGGGGGITNVVAGTGLSGGGSASTVTLNLDPPTSSIIGGVKQGTGISIAVDGTLNLAASSGSVIGGVKQGTGINIAGDGTISVAPPSGGNVGGVKQGTNITIAADGTISASGGGGGGVTNITSVSPIQGSGSGDVQLSFDVSTTALTQYLKLSGGAMTGSIDMGNTNGRYISIGNGSLDQPALRLSTGGKTGMGSIAAGQTLSFIINGIERIRWDNGGSALFANPKFAGADSPFTAGVQIWGSESESVGGTCTGIFASNSDQGASFFYARRCRGTNPQNPQGISTGDYFGGVLCEGSKGSWTPNDNKQCRIYGRTGKNDSDSAEWRMGMTQPGQGLADRLRWGPTGSNGPIDAGTQIVSGFTDAKWNAVYSTNGVIQEVIPPGSASYLQDELGLGFITQIDTFQFTREYIDYVYGPTQIGVDGNPIPGNVTEVVVPDPTLRWGIDNTQVQATLTSLGLAGDYGLLVEEGDAAGINYVELIAPLIKAVQQLAQLQADTQDQLTALQASYDAYVAAHP